MPAAEIYAGLSAFKTMLDTAKTIKGIADTVARNEVAIDLQGQIITAQESYSALLDEVRQLKEKVAGFEKWDAEREKYELKNLGAGTLTYMLKPEARGTAPPHWVCTNCFSDKRISLISSKWDRGTEYSCPRCKMVLWVGQGVIDGYNPKWLD